MLSFVVGLLLVGLVLAYGLRWVWFGTRRRLSPVGKAFVVTGAASGFGKEVTKMLSEQGGYVFAVDFNQELLLREWEDKPNVHPLRGDVTDEKSVESVAREVRKSGKGLFGLFNNAGIAHPGVPLADCPEELMTKVIDVNCTGMWRMAKALFPLLKEENERLKAAGEGSCSIVNMTSMAGLVAVPLMGPYCISKHAAEAMTAVLRRELRSFGIRVSSIEPSFARTPIMAAVDQHSDISEECWREACDAHKTVLRARTLLDPVLIAQAVVDALLSDPAPVQTIVASRVETLAGKFLIHVMPSKVLDFILTEGALMKARLVASHTKKER